MQFLKLKLNILTFDLFMVCNTSGADSDIDPHPDANPEPELYLIRIGIDNSTQYQMINGFCFFEAYNMWWS